MKTFLVGILIFMMCGLSFAQDTTDEVFFGGVRYDDGPLLSMGIGTRLFNNLWSFNYVDVGMYQSANSEFAYLIGFGKFGFGPIAGPNADWQGTQSGETPMTYLVGAGGALVTYDASETWGAWGYYKYKFALQDETMYKDGNVFGLGLFKRF